MFVKWRLYCINGHCQKLLLRFIMSFAFFAPFRIYCVVRKRHLFSFLAFKHAFRTPAEDGKSSEEENEDEDLRR